MWVLFVSRWDDYLNIKKEAKTRYTLIGKNLDGTKFRPSAWTEMLVCLSKSQLIIYDDHLKIFTKNGVRGIMFDDLLLENCPNTFERLISFAKINKLQLTEEELG